MTEVTTGKRAAEAAARAAIGDRVALVAAIGEAQDRHTKAVNSATEAQNAVEGGRHRGAGRVYHRHQRWWVDDEGTQSNGVDTARHATIQELAQQWRSRDGTHTVSGMIRWRCKPP